MEHTAQRPNFQDAKVSPQLLVEGKEIMVRDIQHQSRENQIDDLPSPLLWPSSATRYSVISIRYLILLLYKLIDMGNGLDVLELPADHHWHKVKRLHDPAVRDLVFRHQDDISAGPPHGRFFLSWCKSWDGVRNLLQSKLAAIKRNLSLIHI